MGKVREEARMLTDLVASLVWWVRRLKCPRCDSKFTSATPCRCGLSATYW